MITRQQLREAEAAAEEAELDIVTAQQTLINLGFVVFVRDKNFLKDGSPKVSHTRQVRPAARTDTHVELLAGVLPGEVVASKGIASLRAELLKSGIGEGCCGHHH